MALQLGICLGFAGFLPLPSLMDCLRFVPAPTRCRFFLINKCFIPKDLQNQRSQVFENKRVIFQLMENKGLTGFSCQLSVLSSQWSGVRDEPLFRGTICFSGSMLSIMTRRTENTGKEKGFVFCGFGIFRLTGRGVNPWGATVCVLTVRYWLKNSIHGSSKVCSKDLAPTAVRKLPVE